MQSVCVTSDMALPAVSHVIHPCRARPAQNVSHRRTLFQNYMRMKKKNQSKLPGEKKTEAAKANIKRGM